MNIGQTSANRMSRKLWSGLGLVVLGLGLCLGGCAQNKMSREDLEKENAQLRQQDQEMQAKLAAEANARAAMEAENNSLKTRLATQPPPQAMPPITDYPPAGQAGGTREHRPEREARRFEVSGDVLFASGQAKLKPGARSSLNKIISEIKHNYSGREIRVEGHTDSDPIHKSKWRSNEALSKARAEAVREYMAQHGISRRLIATVGKGSSEPRSTKALSRRVEIIVVE